MGAAIELPGILRQIVERRRERLGAGRAPARWIGAEPVPALGRESQPFLAALAARSRGSGAPGRAVIAEIKLASPRLGSLAGRLDPRRQAELYAAHGAAALSVVVEPDFFGGSYELLSECAAASGLPALAKDFVVDPVQLDWARAAGAAAVLLIAALQPPEELAALASEARRLGLAPLVETHGAGDREALAGGDWELVGINNRDLTTFEVSLEHSLAGVRALPAGALKVSESGLAERADLDRLAAAGFDAFLVGEALLTAGDAAAKLAELTA